MERTRKSWCLCLALMLTVLSVLADPVEEQMEEMERRIRTDMRAKDAATERTISGLTNEIKILQARIHTLEAGNRANQVAFAAYRSAAYDVVDREVIVYDQTWLNTGSYSAESGEFTCPVNGVYYFAVSAYTTGAHTLSTLERTGSAGPAAFADTDHADQGAAVWVTVCAAGERVFVRENNPGSSRVEASRDEATVVSFVGFLIYLS